MIPFHTIHELDPGPLDLIGTRRGERRFANPMQIPVHKFLGKHPHPDSCLAGRTPDRPALPRDHGNGIELVLTAPQGEKLCLGHLQICRLVMQSPVMGEDLVSPQAERIRMSCADAKRLHLGERFRNHLRPRTFRKQRGFDRFLIDAGRITTIGNSRGFEKGCTTATGARKNQIWLGFVYHRDSRNRLGISLWITCWCQCRKPHRQYFHKKAEANSMDLPHR